MYKFSIVATHGVVDRLRATIETGSDLAVVNVEASTAQSAAELAADCWSQRADAVFIGHRAPPDLKNVRLEHPYLQVVVEVDPADTEELRSVTRSGARGIVAPDAMPREFATAVREVLGGHPYASRTVLGELLKQLRTDAPACATGNPSAALPELTRREISVVTHLARGLNNREIARELTVSEAAVKGHLSRIMTKMGVRDRLQLILRAVQANLVPVGQDLSESS